jgi:hypothetical protein
MEIHEIGVADRHPGTQERHGLQKPTLMKLHGIREEATDELCLVSHFGNHESLWCHERAVPFAAEEDRRGIRSIPLHTPVF